MAEKFKIGDIIQLKSGGPKMTVTDVREKHVNTAWFAGSKKEADLPPAAVPIIEQEVRWQG